MTGSVPRGRIRRVLHDSWRCINVMNVTR
jgi:hypothetical protein